VRRVYFIRKSLFDTIVLNSMTNRHELFYNYLAQTSDFPLALDIDRAEGIYLYGANGEK